MWSETAREIGNEVDWEDGVWDYELEDNKDPSYEGSDYKGVDGKERGSKEVHGGE